MGEADRELELLAKSVAARSLGHPLVAQARKLLAEKLPSNLLYHVASHTDDVLQDAILFGVKDALSERELELIALAAAFHDLGFIERTSNNEELGAAMAVEALTRQGGYSESEVKAVDTMIRDTQLKSTSQGMRQISTSKLSNYLLDGDVSNLGRKDFFEKTELVRQEVGVASKEVFYKGLVSFLDAHQWYSEAAKALRAEGKELNRAKLQEMLKTGKYP